MEGGSVVVEGGNVVVERGSGVVGRSEVEIMSEFNCFLWFDIFVSRVSLVMTERRIDMIPKGPDPSLVFVSVIT